MVDYNLIEELGVSDLEVEELIREALGEQAATGDMDDLLQQDIENFQRGNILNGRVVGKAGDDVVVDVGLKSEGLINKSEFDNYDDLEIGSVVEVLLEELEDETGTVRLSKRKADRIRGWEKILETKSEDDVVEGKCMRKIKGGLLVDIGVPVFLPASQVDIRRPSDIGAFIGKTIQAVILKVDEERRNIVISRRRLIEKQREKAKETLLATIKVDDLVKGVVTNTADFGAFVDLGGLDGLLHITDMSWGRINHPSDMLKIGDEIEVKILTIDKEREKIALGLKQLQPSPWETIEERYPISCRVKGRIVNLVSYGAFVQLEEGIEGLVHISEMSWTRRINHPSELLNVEDEVEVVVLDISKEKHEISLGIKQTEVNPWELVAEKFPPGTIIEGMIRNLANYGAFVEIEPGIDGLLHVSDISWTEKISHPNEKFKKGDPVRCVVLDIDQEKQRVGLGVKQLTEDPWLHVIPAAYKPGMVVHGKVTKITNFGVFVELEDGLEGLLHISELSDQKVENPQDVVSAGEQLDVKILRVDVEERKIGLSLKRAKLSDEEPADEKGAPDAAKPIKGGVDEHGALGTDKIEL
ncbi:MAG: 30S ribosomal protein S1 [Planctomycetota bacterium]|nr:30S ribosomal protein S1 [Planctomycetota bacterium]MCZ6493541.1 30S ribosomal protein S1 [Planctomycetota bacterium]MCZ6611508.1 30S ribosomal protein S1 [Planctomycetota bacterium]MCZ6734816.1 30S ribosomal protein S1 [Planctomycetota bacterium]MCZ6811450.1 30S ribosomal protein S1 [Planctomycetota bacterium]